MNIDELSDRDLDTAIARDVLGLSAGVFLALIPKYSTQVQEAWKIADLLTRRYRWMIFDLRLGLECRGTVSFFDCASGIQKTSAFPNPDFVPAAICRAAWTIDQEMKRLNS